MLTKRALTQFWREHDFRPLKRLGQNYLVDENIKNKILSAINPVGTDDILEVGPGFGELTGDIAGKARSVTAVEFDKKAAYLLKEFILKKISNAAVVQGDILKYNTDKVFTKIIGNLPYYITTPIIEKLILSFGSAPAFIMVQKEYAERLNADVGMEGYSSLSCFVRYRASVTTHFEVKRTCFYPEPEVDSVFIEIRKHEKPIIKVKNEDLFFRIIRKSFGQRRKTLRASLTSQGLINERKEDFCRRLDSLGISPNARPEDISLEGFAKIADAY